jgi:hypothetical protein
MARLPLPEDGDGARPARRMDPAGPDVRLAYRVAQNLVADDRIRLQRITIVVQNRVVILTGHADAEIREAVGRIARDSEGVRDVCNLISVPAGRAPVATEPDDPQRRFDEIVAPLREREPRWETGLQAPFHTSVPMYLLLLVAFGWSLLLVAAVELGWQIILIGVGAGVLSVLSSHLLRALGSRLRRSGRVRP